MADSGIDVKIGEIRQTNEFYVVPTQTQGDAQWEELQKLAKIVADHWQTLRFDDPEEDLYVEQIIYVRLFGGKWTRAKIEDFLVQDGKKKMIVFLLDHGKFHQVNDIFNDVADIPDKACHTLDGFAWKFRLTGELINLNRGNFNDLLIYVLGIVPLERTVNFVSQKMGYRRSLKWTDGSLQMVKRLLGLATKLKADLWHFDEKIEAHCGDLFMWFDNDDLRKQGMIAKKQPLSLRRVLCKKHMAEICLNPQQPEVNVSQIGRQFCIDQRIILPLS